MIRVKYNSCTGHTKKKQIEEILTVNRTKNNCQHLACLSTYNVIMKFNLFDIYVLITVIISIITIKIMILFGIKLFYTYI